jgi:hypothetical protein
LLSKKKCKLTLLLQNELAEFHRSHFGDDAISSFSKDFITPSPESAPFFPEENDDWEGEDDLGYYEDGVKRTLTDEQIEIFRHSELRDLQRAQERESKVAEAPHASADKEIFKEASPGSSSNNTRSGKKNKKKPKQFKKEPKPDLRKRTWDVVESGLDSLEYD